MFDVVPFSELPYIDHPVVYIVARGEPAAVSLGLLGLCLGVSGPGYFIRFGYVGETVFCGERHRRHHRASDFSNFGADIALLRVVADEKERCAIETDIRQFYSPPLNLE
jgi:hypothetical protein